MTPLGVYFYELVCFAQTKLSALARQTLTVSCTKVLPTSLHISVSQGNLDFIEDS